MSEENPHAGQGAVLLDIGGDIGALVVTMPPQMVGVEVEILPAGHVGTSQDPAHDHGHAHSHDRAQGHDHGHGHQHRQHVEVVSRPTPAGQVPSLVFPELVEGAYDLMPKGTDDVRLTVDVRGGEVASAVWRTDG